MKTSRTSARLPTAPRARPAGNSVGRSFRLWTARSARCLSKATSSSLVNKPLGRLCPSCAREAVWSLSPVVLMIFSSKVSLGNAARHWARTLLACAKARALPRVATRIEEAFTLSLVSESRTGAQASAASRTRSQQPLHFFANDSFATLDFFLAMLQVVVSDGLEVVNVVEENV